MLNELKAGEVKPYIPEQPVMEYLLRWYKAWDEDRNQKNESYRCLDSTNLDSFWTECEDDYNNIVPLKNKRDWKKQTVRGISRDKANGFIAKITSKLIQSQVMAQNKDQMIDVVVSRVLGTLLEWWLRGCKAHRNFIDIVHTAVIYGTVHVQQKVINGKEIREIIDNREVFVPNLRQHDIQKQSHFIRYQITSYEEAKLIWGDNDNWQFVVAGSADKWAIDNEYFNSFDSGVNQDDECSIMYVWEHTGYDKDGKPKPKKYNVIISGVPMFDIDNKQNLKHNRYPEKQVFEKFADVNFYWGNSLPNKIKHDKRYLDAFRTILLNKAILNLGKVLFNKGGEHIDQDSIVPFNVIPTQMGKDDIFTVDGLNDPITQADWNVEERVEKGVDEATQPPASLGGETSKNATLGEIQLKDYRASELLRTFGQLISFLVEDLDGQSLSNLMQFGTKEDIKNLTNESGVLFQKVIEVGEQPLKQGGMGTASIRLTAKENFPTPIEIAQEERDEKKDITYIDPAYLNDLDKYVFCSANPVDKPSEALERLTAVENYKSVYFNNPFIDQLEATRGVVRANKDDESKLVKEQPVQPVEGELEQGSETPPTQRLKQSIAPKQTANAPTV